MNRLIYPLVIGLLLCLNLNAQEVNDPEGEFMNNTWFLTKIFFDGQDITFQPNSEVEQSTLIGYEDSEDKGFGVVFCTTGGGDGLQFPDNHHFTVDQFVVLADLCMQNDNVEFEWRLLAIFGEPNASHTFSFTITEKGDLEKMVITGDNGNQAYYQTDSVLSVRKKRYRNLKVYPNPAGHYVSVANITSPITLKLYDLLGHQLRSQQVDSSEEKVDMDGLSSSIYIYKLIQDRERVQTGRLVKK